VVTTASGARTLGGTARGLSPWESTRLEAPGKPAIEITATPCRHGPPLSHALVGDVIGFALGSLWISGDTLSRDDSSWDDSSTWSCPPSGSQWNGFGVRRY
jgi:hypothetical protein